MQECTAAYLVLAKTVSVLLYLHYHTNNCAGTGDVIEPHDGVMAIGSGGNYAEAAARALVDMPGFTAMSIAQKAMKIAADSCIYTNHNFCFETVKYSDDESETVQK